MLKLKFAGQIIKVFLLPADVVHMYNALEQKGKGVKRMTKLRRIWHNRVLYLMLLVPFSMLILFRYVPMYGVQIAFKNYQPSDTIRSASWVGFKYLSTSSLVEWNRRNRGSAVHLPDTSGIRENGNHRTPTA